MSLTALLLITVASVTHVGWNLLGKRHSPSVAFFFLACLVGTLLLTPVVIWNRALFAVTPGPVWGLLVLTGFCQATYFVGLAAAYAHGHMSVAYPLARAIPVLLVAAFTAAGSGRIHALAGLGMALIVAGAMLVPRSRFRGWRLTEYRSRSCVFAVLAALGTTGYSLTDDHALALLRDAAAGVAGPTRVTLYYAAFEGLATCLWLVPVVARHASSRTNVRHLLATQRVPVLITGIGIFTTYTLVLVSMAYVDNVSYVVAYRQLSIPLAALAGILLLGEPAWPPKLIGVGGMFAGLVLAAIY